jgi:hypothetical protein
LGLYSTIAQSQSLAWVGVWKTYSDQTGMAESLIRIDHVDGQLRGVVLEIFAPPAPSAQPLCEECVGELKNQPVVGLSILRATPEPNGQQARGEILNPEDGRIYQCLLRPIDGGKALEVRGYIGLPLFGRTQRWVRVP